MKRLIAMLLACMLLVLCGCGADGEGSVTNPSDDSVPAGEVYVNPLNGEILDAPYTGRIFAVSICNTPNAVPHISLNEADVVMEMFVNNTVIRDFALFTNIRDVEVLGSVRSTRLLFNEIVEHYDAVLIHSGSSDSVAHDFWLRGLDNFNLSLWDLISVGASYRDEEYDRDYEASLFARGETLYEYAKEQGVSVEQPAGKDYGLRFTDEGTPAKGDAAENIEIAFNFEGFIKKTEMKYDKTLDQYVYHQYDREMRDLINDEPEAFKNVIIMKTETSIKDIYHVSEFVEGGEGWFACGGKLIPIQWSCAGDFEPFVFMNMDGTVLELERGNTYIAIMSNDSGGVLWN